MVEPLAGAAVLVLLPVLTTLFHELGHAVPALVQGDRRVIVIVGRPSVRIDLGRLVLFLGISSPEGVDHEGLTVAADGTTTRATIVRILGGSFAGLGFLLLFALLVLPRLPVDGLLAALVALTTAALAVDQGWQVLTNTEGSDGMQWRVLRALEQQERAAEAWRSGR